MRSVWISDRGASRGRRGARLLCALALALGCATPTLSSASSPGEFAAFSLVRARDAQERDTTSAAPYRSNLPWPVGRVEAERKRWAVGTAGLEYDSHPVVLSNAWGTLDEMSDADAANGVWFVDAGGELFEHGAWSGGAAVAYWGNAWSGWDRTTHYPELATHIDWRLGEPWALRLRYDLGYANVGGDGFATTHHVGPRIYRDWGGFGVSEAYFEYYDYDFHRIGATYPRTETGMPGGPCAFPGGPIPTPCGPPDSKADRDRRIRSGFGLIFAGEHRVRLEGSGAVLRGGYFYQHSIPDGAEFHGQSHAFWMGAAVPLPARFEFDSSFTYTYRFTRDPTSFADPDDLAPNTVYPLQGTRRFDHVVRVYSALARPITKRVSAAAEYGYTHHQSNLESFDFDRHRIGATVTVHFE